MELRRCEISVSCVGAPLWQNQGYRTKENDVPLWLISICVLVAVVVDGGGIDNIGNWDPLGVQVVPYDNRQGLHGGDCHFQMQTLSVVRLACCVG